ncbi:MAG: hypothetical protein AAFW64_00505 [Pseudomonadota bacterium]
MSDCTLTRDDFRNIAQHLLVNDIAFVAAQVQNPFVVYLPNQLLVLDTKWKLYRMLRQYCLVLRACAATSVRLSKVEAQITAPGQETYRVLKTYADAHGDSLGHVDVTYFVRSKSHRRVIEMVEYTRNTLLDAHCAVPMPQAA